MVQVTVRVMERRELRDEGPDRRDGSGEESRAFCVRRVGSPSRDVGHYDDNARRNVYLAFSI